MEKPQYSLHLFAGGGGGILADVLHGVKPVCAVEIEDFQASILGLRFPDIPVWDDVTTFREETPSAPKSSETSRPTVMSLSFVADFRAKIFRLRALARVYRERVVDFGLSTRESFAKYDPVGCSWKTPQCLFGGDLARFSDAWPQAGMMRHGECFRLPLWDAAMSARGYGSLVGEETDDGTAESARPTPTVNGNNNFVGAGEKSGDGLGTAVLKKMGEFAPRVTSEKVKARLSALAWPTPTCAGLDGGSNSRKAAKRRGRYIGSGVGSARPTPTRSDYKGANPNPGKRSAGGVMPASEHSLATRVATASGLAWPTPTAHASHTIGNEKSRDGLNYAVERGEGKRKKYPTALTRSTPTAEDAFGSGFGKGHRPLNRQAKSFGSARPTPCATDAKGSGGRGEDRDRLDYAVERGRTKSHTYPTPRCRDLCGGTGAHEKIAELAEVGIQDAEEARALGAKVGDEAKTSAQLNPDWVEWLMNWPVGWTDPDAVALLMFGPSDDPADLDETDRLFIPRVTTRREFRIKRIVTLGNGQVPLCALAAELWGLAVLDPTI